MSGGTTSPLLPLQTGEIPEEEREWGLSGATGHKSSPEMTEKTVMVEILPLTSSSLLKTSKIPERFDEENNVLNASPEEIEMAEVKPLLSPALICETEVLEKFDEENDTLVEKSDTAQAMPLSKTVKNQKV